MELDVEKIVEKFLLYTGETADGTDIEREKLCRLLCEETGAQVAAQISDETRAQPLTSALEAFAAAQAFYQLAVLDEAAAPKSVSSPEMKLEAGERAKSASRLCGEKRKACAAVLFPPDFYFDRVRI